MLGILKMSEKELIYLTYQTFPSQKANTIQTIENLKYFSKNNKNISLIYPLREKNSSDNAEFLKKFYNFDEKIKFIGTDHNLPFGKINFLNKYTFLFSHYQWSKKTSRNIIKNYSSDNFYFTRSEWIFYFLSKNNFNIIFECHQMSKIRKFLIKKSIEYKYSKIVFLNNRLINDSGINIEKFYKKLLVLPNGVDINLFKKNVTKKKNKIIFAGNLERFGVKRDLSYIIDAFDTDEIKDKYTLKIISGTNKLNFELLDYIKSKNLENYIFVESRKNRLETINEIQNAEIGLLFNSSQNEHSVKYTSPLKYFEYLYGELKIIAVDYPAHRDLPFSENIIYFKENDTNSFLNSLMNTENIKPISKKNLESISLDFRVKKLLQLFQ
tara:strand:+ start:143 stop:1288 length:1146 start_codon:yes stop_codon:yes gene_type:complete